MTISTERRRAALKMVWVVQVNLGGVCDLTGPSTTHFYSVKYLHPIGSLSRRFRKKVHESTHGPYRSRNRRSTSFTWGGFWRSTPRELLQNRLKPFMMILHQRCGLPVKLLIRPITFEEQCLWQKFFDRLIDLGLQVLKSVRQNRILSRWIGQSLASSALRWSGNVAIKKDGEVHAGTRQSHAAPSHRHRGTFRSQGSDEAHGRAVLIFLRCMPAYRRERGTGKWRI